MGTAIFSRLQKEDAGKKAKSFPQRPAEMRFPSFSSCPCGGGCPRCEDTIQRKPLDGSNQDQGAAAGTLTHPCFKGQVTLEACLKNQHVMDIGETDHDAVQRVQRALHLGWKYPMEKTYAKGDADGKFGMETYNTVKDFKTAHGIKTADGVIDGKVGPKTMENLDKLCAEKGRKCCLDPKPGKKDPKDPNDPNDTPPILMDQFRFEESCRGWIDTVKRCHAKAIDMVYNARSSVDSDPKVIPLFMKFFLTATPDKERIKGMLSAIYEDLKSANNAYSCHCDLPPGGAVLGEKGYVIFCGDKNVTVHLCMAFLGDDNEITDTIIHEFAHRNGACYGKAGENSIIEKYCCGSNGCQGISESDALRNADSYSGFCSECQHGPGSYACK